MALAGYDASLGDSWAINEIGAPTTAQMGIDVLRNVGTARARICATSSRSPPAPARRAPGSIFAADPLQVTDDLSTYKQALSWYRDAPFWDDIGRYVQFLGAGPTPTRSWGVAGSTLAERTAYLSDYFESGSRLAAAGGDGTAAADAFFDRAYVPLANAAFRWSMPNLETGIGFGFTDVGVEPMQSFVSAQTSALRTSPGPARLRR